MVVTIRDVDGAERNVTDFENYSLTGTVKKTTALLPEEVLRPDALAERVYGGSRRYNGLIYGIPKCLFDVEEGDTVEYYV